MKSFRERRAWVVGLVSVLLLAAGVAGAFSIDRVPALRGVYSVEADFRDAAGVQPGNEVRVAGVRVGRVTDVSLTRNAARVEMELESDIQLPGDIRAAIKLKTLLGQKFIELNYPSGLVGEAPAGSLEGILFDGDVIPRDQTSIPYEIYQAANEGTDKLERIDKAALRRLIRVLSETVGTSRQELRRVLVSVAKAGKVLTPKSEQLTALLRHTESLTGDLAESDSDIDSILQRSSSVLNVLAERRRTLISLLAATADLSNHLGTLIRSSRGSIRVGVTDLNGILTLAEGELATIENALEELPRSLELFAQPLQFGRFAETHACTIISADTCSPSGSPTQPGLPNHGQQPGAEVAMKTPFLP